MDRQPVIDSQQLQASYERRQAALRLYPRGTLVHVVRRINHAPLPDGQFAGRHIVCPHQRVRCEFDGIYRAPNIMLTDLWNGSAWETVQAHLVLHPNGSIYLVDARDLQPIASDKT